MLNFIFHASQCHSSAHERLSHTTSKSFHTLIIYKMLTGASLTAHCPFIKLRQPSEGGINSIVQSTVLAMCLLTPTIHNIIICECIHLG
jgi:hypothetical protein